MSDEKPKKKKKRTGNPIITFRVPPEYMAAIKDKVESCNLTRKEEPYTVSSFIRASIMERFEKYARSYAAAQKKKQNKKAAAQPAEELPAAEQLDTPQSFDPIAALENNPPGRHTVIYTATDENGTVRETGRFINDTLDECEELLEDLRGQK